MENGVLCSIMVHSISHREPECVPGRPQTDFRTCLDSDPEVPASNERYIIVSNLSSVVYSGKHAAEF